MQCKTHVILHSHWAQASAKQMTAQPVLAEWLAATKHPGSVAEGGDSPNCQKHRKQSSKFVLCMPVFVPYYSFPLRVLLALFFFSKP